jgi:hypothetical protein
MRGLEGRDQLDVEREGEERGGVGRVWGEEGLFGVVMMRRAKDEDATDQSWVQVTIGEGGGRAGVREAGVRSNDGADGQGWGGRSSGSGVEEGLELFGECGRTALVPTVGVGCSTGWHEESWRRWGRKREVKRRWRNEKGEDGSDGADKNRAESWWQQWWMKVMNVTDWCDEDERLMSTLEERKAGLEREEDDSKEVKQHEKSAWLT